MMLGKLVPSLGEPPMRVELDKKALFALASDTRLDILRALQPMRRTVTQLAESLDVDKAAVHRHLKKLIEGELVRRHEDHGFVYYGLSWKARDLLAPNENTKVIVHLSAFFWAVMGVIAASALAVGSRFASVSGLFSNQTGGSDTTVFTGPGGVETTYQYLGRVTSPASPLWPLLAIVLAVTATILLFQAWRVFRRPRQRTAPGEPAETPAP